MLQNKDIETLRMLFSSHNYVMTTAELTASKLYYADIKQLLDEGLIERVRRGYYHWTQDYGESEVVIINRLFPDAVLCMETALFYYRYSDRNPAEWNFAIDKKDFYDIYYLSRTFNFEGAKLQAAIFETLQRRGTPYDRDSFKRVVALGDDEDMQKRWKFFLKTIKDNTLEFSFIITEIQTFLEPVFDAIVNEKEWQEQWNFIMKWNKNERSPKL